MLDDTIRIPEPPRFMPEAERREWLKRFSAAYVEARKNYPGDPTAWRQSALHEANRMLRVEKPADYHEAKALPDWKVIHRKEENGVLTIVTIDAKRCVFNAPPPDATKNAHQSAPQDASGAPTPTNPTALTIPTTPSQTGEPATTPEPAKAEEPAKAGEAKHDVA